MVLGILYFVLVVLVLFLLYWTLINTSERVRAFDDYLTLRITSGSIRKINSRKKKYDKRLATIHKYEDAWAVFRSVRDGYLVDKDTVTVRVFSTSLEYVEKILRKECVNSYKIVKESGSFVDLRIEL